jgi:hypothetical protein
VIIGGTLASSAGGAIVATTSSAQTISGVNLDGIVNAADFSILAANFGKGLTNWDQGNFVFTPVINGADFAALAVNFSQGDSGATASATQADVQALDSFAAANGLPMPTIGAVPEPTSLGLFALAGTVTLARRRRKQARTPA